MTRKKGKLGYIHLFHTNEHPLAAEDDENGDQAWEGKVKKV